MPSNPPLLAILSHTPGWVWVLLAALSAAGLAQAVPRRIGLRRALLLPGAMLGWSLWSVASRFDSPIALLAWALGVVAATASCVHLGAPADARWTAADRSLHLPGSWIPLGLILALFGVKFGVGVALALRPQLAADAAWVCGVSLAFGVFSGIFAGRALALLRLAQDGAVPAAA